MSRPLFPGMLCAFGITKHIRSKECSTRKTVNSISNHYRRSFKNLKSGILKAKAGSINDVMNADEVSSWLRIPKSTLYKLCSEGQIPCTKIGKHWRFDKALVQLWFEERV
ncbi:MAG: helix-turn-helix domain-containing protein, partial [Pseudomonadota bacterium]